MDQTAGRLAHTSDAPASSREARHVEPNPKTAPDPESNGEKDPADWLSGDDPMTGAQASYLKTLSEETGTAAYRDDLTKAEASVLIDELKTARDRSR
ncbi:DUF3072 domain-containing protein [Chelatococcus sambhunathii]|uniref:DUF3072 domain-containing protein n=1 Tax=Chelatococcus sambhunathii TaxID=363953 RepID=A0ABU1DCC0_9HYPH|nr:DUF3072 domain-containing protein [Chelatococcus sambhunathii]MDR4305756.1 DUF3072 domain-containing protein [Chelatococcus sambhunathii]